MPHCNSRRVRGNQYGNRNSAFVIESCNDDNDVRKASFRFRNRLLIALVPTDPVRRWPQVIKKRMPGMIEPELIAELNARDLTIQTLLITGVCESDTAHAQVPSLRWSCKSIRRTSR